MMKKTCLMFLSITVMCIMFSGCGEEASLQYKALYGGTTCIILGVDNKEVTSLVIPEVINGMTVTQIEMRAFADCTKLKKVEFPDTLETIGMGAFCDCSSLKEISLPVGLKEIHVGAFLRCISLETVEFNEELNVIGPNAFEECISLKEIELPSGLKSLMKGAFSNCTSLKKVTIPDGIERIGVSVFENCTALKKIVFPNELKEIGENAFAGCASLEKPELPETLEVIDKGAFKNCTRLSTLWIPPLVRSIHGGEAFDGCDNLKNIKVSENNLHFTSKDINGNEVNAILDSSSGILCVASMNELIIPEGVTTIRSHIYKDKDLKIIEVPASISAKTLNSILYYNPNLTTVCGVSGSEAERWAEENNIKFEAR